MTDNTEPVTVVVADDQSAVREGLVLLLGTVPGIAVIGEAEDGEAAVEAVVAKNPQVVLMDLNMPRCDGVEATRRIRAGYPQTQVIVLTTYSDDESIIGALQAGALGYLTKDATKPAPQPLLRRRPTTPSGLQGRADQAREVLVGDARRVLRPQPDRPLAGPQLGMALGEAAVVPLSPAVDRDSVLPGADVEPPLADLVGGDLIGQRHVGVRVGGHDQLVHPVEQRAVGGVDGVDVIPYGFIHGSASPVTTASSRTSGARTARR
jgi:CheY-like chemotaxis protein